MTDLLAMSPFGPRDDAAFLREMNRLCTHHAEGCPLYRKIIKEWRGAAVTSDLPFVHVGVFKHLELITDAPGIVAGRMLNSSATSSGKPSQIRLDHYSSELQSRSSSRILEALLGPDKRPLLVLDSAASLRSRVLPARLAAAMSLKPLATEIHFLLTDAADPATMKWDAFVNVLKGHDRILVYGFTWMLWLAFTGAHVPAAVREAMAGKHIDFVHSGGWKKLEAERVTRDVFDAALMIGLSPSSRSFDLYGLVEQVGLLFPLDDEGFRLVPAWADCLVRDPHSLEVIYDKPGLLQLMNTLPHGAPYHSVLTEDMALMSIEREDYAGPRRFRLLGRVPNAEIRGCANV